MDIAVVALGKIGLPLAVQFASRGHRVIGSDINPETVELVNRGIEPFPGEHALAEKLKSVVEAGLLSATTDTRHAVSCSNFVVVVVPLFVDSDGRPDFAWIDAATHDIAAGLKRGDFVSYETTLPVGTTRDRFGPMLEAGSGLTVGDDVLLVFSPERVFTGRVFSDLRKYPKLVGGVNSASTEAGVDFYQHVLEFDLRDDLPRSNGVWSLASTEAAEMAKLAETTYRDVNIGLANQFARFADTRGIDVYEVIAASNSQPYSHLHTPGIAVGGHCIPIYPRMYLWNDPDATIVREARSANAAMPEYAIGELDRAFGGIKEARVAVLGAAYRGGVKETAFSGVFPTVAELRARGAIPVVHDPMYTEDELRALGFEPYSLGTPIDAAIVQADHAEYRHLSPTDLPGVRILFDGRRITDPGVWPQAVHRTLGAP